MMCIFGGVNNPARLDAGAAPGATGDMTTTLRDCGGLIRACVKADVARFPSRHEVFFGAPRTAGRRAGPIDCLSAVHTLEAPPCCQAKPSEAKLPSICGCSDDCFTRGAGRAGKPPIPTNIHAFGKATLPTPTHPTRTAAQAPEPLFQDLGIVDSGPTINGDDPYFMHGV
jgi:hypothetical protein